MKILVTGASGFVGANLVRSLLKQSTNEVFISARKTSDFARIADIKDRFAGIAYTDLSDGSAVHGMMREFRPEIVYHIATYGGFPGQKDQTQMIKSNLIATVNLLDASVETEVKHFINTGSSSEYGIKSAPMCEDDFCEPINFYGVTKLAATNYCSMIGKVLKFPVCTLRLFSVYGPLEDPTRLYPSIVTTLLQGQAPKLSKPDSVRDFTPVEKIVEVYQNIIHTAYEPGSIINVATGRQKTIAQFYKMIAAKLHMEHVDAIWGQAESRQFEPKVWEANITKLKNLLPEWEPEL